MNICIGENIKRLRRDKNITQEKLAEHLNVSTQAVSKWERNETYPDITMILPLASYFCVTTDKLLGLDAAKNEEKIENYISEFRKLSALGKSMEKYNLMCTAYKEFPNDFRIVDEYMWQLTYDPNCKEAPYGNEVHKEELYKLCDRVFDECRLDKPRYSALSILSSLYCLDGNIEKAIETAKRFPEHYYFTADEEMENIYVRGTEEWFPCVQKNIKNLTECLMVKIRNCALHSKADAKTRIRILQKAVDLLNLIYDDGDYGFDFYNLCELNIWIAYRYLDLKEYNTAFDYLDKGLAYGKAYDELPTISKHTSFLVDTITDDMMKICCGESQNEIARELEILDLHFGNGDIGKMDRFKTIVEKYKPYAKNEKQHN
ncbi:MAG: helix-turn-helix transcriptional regulator [Eubacteriales bacterium]